jgi:hypothetical protein
MGLLVEQPQASALASSEDLAVVLIGATLAMVLITALILALCACGGEGDTENTAPDGAMDCGTWDHRGSTQPDPSELPGIILEDHREWVDLYWVAWEIARAKIQTGTPENEFVEAYMDEGFSKNIYQWDTIFMTLFGRYSNGEFPSIVSLENFYRKQHDNGYICREIRESDGTDFIYRTLNDTVNPPLFAWAEWQH